MYSLARNLIVATLGPASGPAGQPITHDMQKHITNMTPPPFYIHFFLTYLKYNCFVRSGFTPGVRPDLRFGDEPNMPNMLRNAKYFKYVFMNQPRVRWAGLRSSAAVDMFARGAAVTVTLFSFSNAWAAG